jgi:WS/DGAT/MGAT family acyltransferase
MGASDALLWTINRDPVLRMTVVAVVMLDGPPVWDELVKRVEALVQAVPRLRSKVLPPRPGWGRIRWVEDRRFDLSLHLRHVALPGGTLRAVLDFAQASAVTAFDPELPLWEATLVDGLERGRAALVLKVHHAVVDGIGGLAVISQLLDEGPAGPARPATGEQAPGGETRAPDALGGLLATVRRAAVLPCQSAGLVARSLSHPARTAVEVGATVASAFRLLQPAPTPCSPLLRGRGIGRQFEVLALPAGALRSAAAATGTTLNEVFVTGVLGGLARYHDIHGVPVDNVRAMMPVSIRAPGDETMSNRFVPARFVLPLGPAEIHERLDAVRQRAGAWKHAPALGLSDVMAGVLTRLPAAAATALFGAMLKGADFVATNVPGPAHPASFAGAGMVGFYAFAPPSGAAVNVALVTHADDTFVGCNIDPEAVHDPQVLAGCLQEGFDEVVGLAGTAPATRPARVHKKATP